MILHLNLVSAEITFIIHATEDSERTLSVIAENFQISSDIIKHFSFEGYFKNPVSLYKAIVLNEKADLLAERILTSLSKEDRSLLNLELSNYIDEDDVLHLRIGKQSIFQGKISLSDIDVVKIKFKPKLKMKSPQNLSRYRPLLD